jgi:hypothetical protein
MPVTQAEIARYGLRLSLNDRFQYLWEARQKVESGRLYLSRAERWVLERETERVFAELCRYLPETWRDWDE